MLNYVAILWNNFWIFDRWSDAGFQMTPTFERNAWLPRLSDYARQISSFFWYHAPLGAGDRYTGCRAGLVDFCAEPLGL